MCVRVCGGSMLLPDERQRYACFRCVWSRDRANKATGWLWAHSQNAEVKLAISRVTGWFTVGTGKTDWEEGEKKCYFLRKYSDVWWISHHFWHGTCLNYKMMKDTGGIQLWFYISQMLNSRGTPVRMQAPWQQHNRSQTVGQALLTRWKVQVKHEFKQEGGQNEAWDSPISFNSANQVTRNKGSPINP